MLNGQLKAAYNVRISTSNQSIVNYTINPNPMDTNTLQANLAQHEFIFGKSPLILKADAEKEIIASVRYNMFEKEQNSKHKSKHPFSQCKLFYSPD